MEVEKGIGQIYEPAAWTGTSMVKLCESLGKIYSPQAQVGLIPEKAVAMVYTCLHRYLEGRMITKHRQSPGLKTDTVGSNN